MSIQTLLNQTLTGIEVSSKQIQFVTSGHRLFLMEENIFKKAQFSLKITEGDPLALIGSPLTDVVEMAPETFHHGDITYERLAYILSTDSHRCVFEWTRPDSSQHRYIETYEETPQFLVQSFRKGNHRFYSGDATYAYFLVYENGQQLTILNNGEKIEEHPAVIKRIKELARKEKLQSLIKNNNDLDIVESFSKRYHHLVPTLSPETLLRHPFNLKDILPG